VAALSKFKKINGHKNRPQFCGLAGNAGERTNEFYPLKNPNLQGTGLVNM